MPREAQKWLEDILAAAELIGQFVARKTFDDYASDSLLSSGVERQFEIIGESLNRLVKIDAAFSSQITGAGRIIAFRNILIHGYHAIDHHVVWDVVQNHLPTLRSEVQGMLENLA